MQRPRVGQGLTTALCNFMEHQIAFVGILIILTILTIQVISLSIKSRCNKNVSQIKEGI